MNEFRRYPIWFTVMYHRFVWNTEFYWIICLTNYFFHFATEIRTNEASNWTKGKLIQTIKFLWFIRLHNFVPIVATHYFIHRKCCPLYLYLLYHTQLGRKKHWHNPEVIRIYKKTQAHAYKYICSQQKQNHEDLRKLIDRDARP